MKTHSEQPENATLITQHFTQLSEMCDSSALLQAAQRTYLTELLLWHQGYDLDTPLPLCVFYQQFKHQHALSLPSIIYSDLHEFSHRAINALHKTNGVDPMNMILAFNQHIGATLPSKLLHYALDTTTEFIVKQKRVGGAF